MKTTTAAPGERSGRRTKNRSHTRHKVHPPIYAPRRSPRRMTTPDATLVQPPLFGVAQSATTSDDYYTPSWVFERLGLAFDLDVASPPGGLPWIPAARFFTAEDDGLAQPWTGRVWMNPPYSNATPWVRRFIQHRHGICLVPHAKARWHSELWDAADAVCQTPDRFTFAAGPQGGSIMFAVWFAAFGDECSDALSRLGVVRKAA